jgi:hypothetical protein
MCGTVAQYIGIDNGVTSSLYTNQGCIQYSHRYMEKYIGGGEKKHNYKGQKQSLHSACSLLLLAAANEHLCSTVPCAAVAAATADCSEQA